MRNPFFAKVQIALSKLTTAADLAAQVHSNDLPAIQQLKKDEYLAVAGGPQVENEPD